MPLFDVSPNVHEAQSPSRKRTLDDFAQMERGELPGPKCDHAKVPDIRGSDNKENGWVSTPKNLELSGVDSSPASLTPSGSSPVDRRSVSPNPTPPRNPSTLSPGPALHHEPHDPALIVPSPVTLDPSELSAKRKREHKEDNNAPAPRPLAEASPAPGGADATSVLKQPPGSGCTGQPPAKRKRATKAESEARKSELAAEREKKAAEKATIAAQKAAEKARQEADKQARAEERERKRREKEEEEAKKAEEKAKKAEEKAKKTEEQAKKARAQPTLSSFFKPKNAAQKENKTEEAAHPSPASTPKKTQPKEVSLYEQMFKPFFVKDQVTVAPLFQMDETTRDVKTRIFEEYVEGKRGVVKVTPFEPEQSLQLPFLLPRGRLYPSVRNIMAEWIDNSSRKSIDLTTESQNTQIRKTRAALQDVPMKFLGFKEDVRPAYYGTVTNLPSDLTSLRKLARNPVAKDVLPLSYDYDSEAEWQEEDGEDVDSVDDDEDDVENDEDMGDFLDDSEDVSLVRPLVVSGLEPESTGICWENRKRLGPLPHMYKFRMEFILDTLDHHSCIDPFSTEYWEPVKPAPTASTHLAPPTSVLSTEAGTNTMLPPAPTDAFKALTASSAGAPAKKAPALQADMVQRLKEMVVAKRGLSKLGIVELFNSETKCPKAAIKNTLETIAEKSGKEWVLKTGL